MWGVTGFVCIAVVRTKRLLRMTMTPGATGIAVAEVALPPLSLQHLRVPVCYLPLGILSRLRGLGLYGAPTFHSPNVKSTGNLTIVGWVFRLFASAVDPQFSVIQTLMLRLRHLVCVWGGTRVVSVFMVNVICMIISCSACQDGEREIIVLDSFWRGMADGPKQGSLR